MTQTVPGLEARDLRVQFGGLVAVDKVTLEAPLRQITGLIGPNGAGKTTTFNACSGLNSPTEGQISLFGNDVSSASVASRARLGLGRTFQHVQVCPGLTVRQNVALGAEVTLVGRNPFKQVFSSRIEGRRVRELTDEALELCGISDLASTSAAVLSTGQRRLLELARVLAGDARLLLLDEPSSGLDDKETDRFGEILSQVVHDRGVGVLVVEHDMSLVMGVCDYLYVLDFGQLIFEGTPTETQRSEIVRRAYLGIDIDVTDEGDRV